jgi:intron-binding protein aquarius
MLFEATLEAATGCYRHIERLFGKLEKMRAFEILKSDLDRGNYILKKVSKIIAITSSSLSTMYEDLLTLGLEFESVVVMDAQHLRDIQSLAPLCLQTLSSNTGSSSLKRVILFGDRNQVQGTAGGLNCLRTAALNQSLFERLIKTGVAVNGLLCQFTTRPSLIKLYESWYGESLNAAAADQFQVANPGFCFDYQFIDVPDYGGQGELEPRSGFYQNLGEAEYSVALYQYMRLAGYPSDKITILTPYNGQRELILDVLQRRCAWHPFFGSPKGVFNIDEYKCDQTDVVILSLVRTKVYDGILRDRRTWISALSKARLGVYVLGRHTLFKQVSGIQSIVDQMQSKPVSGLWLQTGDVYEQCARASGDSGVKLNAKTQTWEKIKSKDNNAVQEIKSLKDLGVLVQTLTKSKVALLKAQKQQQA